MAHEHLQTAEHAQTLSERRPSQIVAQRLSTRIAGVLRSLAILTTLGAPLFLDHAADAREPRRDESSDRVDLIEVNHCFDGSFMLHQLVFYEWLPDRGDYGVVDWRRLKSSDQLPVKDGNTGEYIALWRDTRTNNRLRTVRATHMKETWTSYDPEYADTEKHPREARRGLSRPVPDALANPPTPAQEDVSSRAENAAVSSLSTAWKNLRAYRPPLYRLVRGG